ncbi:very-long-chain 3-oxoacyl-CoA reductase 1 [Ricinus communis]|uniref:Steroid dehydrogenase, putative n=1 Tax=Ricinus communis TaxID=3988 RepID=B9RMQ8_RICCO|nr:very-long-chain 3-oxoacyl-CoA reductase 1 [Ricinus communis]EEF47581.1 steroid dehydrogenase, putative [Ricinus communis]|eukprot:XP_002515027.1 very-long-chain 3-oxoacyl-CoA reductase 1 [Ricinus communis]
MAVEVQDFILIAVSGLGFISLIKQIFIFWRWVWVMFLRPPKNLKKQYGSWAIITGSTDGIGKALAFELASKGLNLVLVGRNPSKLEATSHEIKARSGAKQEVQIKTIVIDFAKSSGEETSRKIEDGIQGLDVGVLINNAGLAYSYPMYFHEVDQELMDSLVKVNAEAATWVIRAVIPAMMRKKKGAIVNIGSGSSVVVPSYPLIALYASTKAYLAMFSRCINLEYKHHGIDTQCQIPLFVATKMTRLKSSFTVASAEMYAKASIRWIGYEQLCTPFWAHSFEWFILQALPDSVLDWMLFRIHNYLRKKGLENDALLNQEINVYDILHLSLL